MSDATINLLLAVLGSALAAAGASGALGHPWSALLSAVGGAIVGQATMPRRGDVKISDLPAEIQEAVRPSKSP